MKQLQHALEQIGFKPPAPGKKKSFDKDEDGEDTLEKHQATESWQGRFI